MTSSLLFLCFLSLRSVLVVGNLATGELSPDNAGHSEALGKDDVCLAEGGSDCDVSLRQLRGEKVRQDTRLQDRLSDDSWGSCHSYGCGARYNRQHGCQCNSACARYRNCCSDYKQLCSTAAPAVSAPSPEEAAAAPEMQENTQVHGHPDPSKIYPTYPGFSLTLVEEFDQAIDLDADPIWTWSDGGLFEGSVRFVKEQIQFEGGKMKITAKPNPGIATQSCSHAEVGTVAPKPLVSGEMRARHNLFRYGRYEVRMKAPEVQPGNPDINGNFISTMFVYRDAKFKHWREIDIEVTGDSPNSVTTNMLSADHTSQWSPHIASSEGVRVDGNARAQFHTYAFEWLPDSVTWYVDGKKVRTVTGGHHPPIPDLSGKIMMNLWIFGPDAGFGGKAIYNNQYPMTNEYDWFRFYKWNGETSYPCADMSDSCLTVDDKYLSSNNPCDQQPQLGSLNGKQACTATCVR